MSCIHYKLVTNLNYEKLTFDGVHISVGDLKKEIIEKKFKRFHYKNLDIDLEITNADTNEVYSKENDVIPKNSRVYIKRVIKNIQPVKGGIITNTQKEQELKEIQMKKTYNALLTNTSSSTTTTTTTTKIHDANGNEQTDPKPKAHLPTTTITNTNISNTVNIQISNYTRTDEIALANAITKSINIDKFNAESFEKSNESRKPWEQKANDYPKELTCPFGSHLMVNAVMASCCGYFVCCEKCIYDRLGPNSNYQAIVECPNENCLQEITSTKHLMPHKQLRSMVQDYLNFTANSAKSGSQASDLNGIAAKNVCTQPNESQGSEVYFNENHHQTKQNSFKSSVGPDNHQYDAALKNSDTTHLNYIPVLQSQTYNAKFPNRINGLDYQGVEQNTYYETHPYDNYYTEPTFVSRSDVNRYHGHYGYNQTYNPIGFYNRDLTEADPNYNCDFVSSSSNTVANYYNQTAIASLPVLSTTPFFEKAPDNSVHNFNATQSDSVHVATKRKKSYSPSSIYSRFSSSSSSDSDKNSQSRSEVTDTTSKSRSRSHSRSQSRSDSRHLQPQSSNNNNDRQQHKKSRDNGSSTSRYKNANVLSHRCPYEKRQKADDRQANDNYRSDRSRRSEKHIDHVRKRTDTRYDHYAHKMSSYERNNQAKSKSASRSNEVKKIYANNNNTRHDQSKRRHSNRTYYETERQHDRNKQFQSMHKADKDVRTHKDKNKVSHELDIPKRVSASSIDKSKFSANCLENISDESDEDGEIKSPMILRDSAIMKSVIKLPENYKSKSKKAKMHALVEKKANYSPESSVSNTSRIVSFYDELSNKLDPMLLKITVRQVPMQIEPCQLPIITENKQTNEILEIQQPFSNSKRNTKRRVYLNKSERPNTSECDHNSANVTENNLSTKKDECTEQTINGQSLESVQVETVEQCQEDNAKSLQIKEKIDENPLKVLNSNDDFVPNYDEDFDDNLTGF